MELNVTLSVLVLLPVALALVAGGFILYRKSKQAGWRAAGMGSLALGVGALLVITLTLPVFQSSEGEAPGTVTVGLPGPDQLKKSSTTGQGPSSPAANTSPVIPHGAPRVNLTYEGAVYYATPLNANEAANLNENDLELVSATNESNLLLPVDNELRRFIVDLSHDNPELTLSEIKDRVEAEFQIGIDNSTVSRTLQGLSIYKLKDGEEGHVYTFTPGQSKVNPEDGQIFEFPAMWMRWDAADSNGT